MEVVGVVASLIGISELGVKISKGLYSIGNTLVKARDQINDLARELSNIAGVFGLLADVLETSEEVVKPEALRTTQAILDDCNNTYDEIASQVSATEEKLATRARITWPFRKAKVKQLRKRLECSKASLNLVVNIINLSTGITWLRKQKKPSDATVETVKTQFRDATEWVIEVQLSSDEAEISEIKAIEEAKSDFDDADSLEQDHRWALVRMRPIQQQLAAEIPEFKDLSLVTTTLAAARRIQHQNLELQQSRDDRIAWIEQEAPRIVRRLLISWTNIDDLPSPKQSAGVQLHPKPIPLTGSKFSPTRHGGDEPPARRSLYNTVERAKPSASLPRVARPVQSSSQGRSNLLSPPLEKVRNDNPKSHPPSSQRRAGPTIHVEYARTGDDHRPDKVTESKTADDSLAEEEDNSPDILKGRIPGFLQPVSLEFNPFSIDDGLLTVHYVKYKVRPHIHGANFEGPSDKVFLLYKGKVLDEDKRSVRSYGVRDGSELVASLLDPKKKHRGKITYPRGPTYVPIDATDFGWDGWRWQQLKQR